MEPENLCFSFYILILYFFSLELSEVYSYYYCYCNGNVQLEFNRKIQFVLYLTLGQEVKTALLKILNYNQHLLNLTQFFPQLLSSIYIFSWLLTDFLVPSGRRTHRSQCSSLILVHSETGFTKIMSWKDSFLHVSLLLKYREVVCQNTFSSTKSSVSARLVFSL